MSSSSPPSRTSWILRTGLSLILAIVILVVLELAGRQYYQLRTGDSWTNPGLDVTRPPDLNLGVVSDEDNALGFAVFDPARLVRLQPYLGQKVHINRLGFRGPEIDPQKPAGVCRIAMLGGSTTYGWGASSDETTIPALLEQYLRSSGLESLQVINAGVPGYISTQDLMQLQSQVLPLEPDIVILYTGVNDARYAVWARWQPHMSDWSRQIERLAWIGAWTQQLGLGWAAVLDLGTYLANHSYLAFAVRGLVDRVINGASQRPRIVDPEATEGDRYTSSVNPEAMAIFARNLRDMVHLTRAHGAQPLLAFPPTETTVALPMAEGPERDAVIAQLQGRPRGLAEAENVLWDVAQQMDVPLVKLNDVLNPTPAQYLLPPVHLNDGGNAAVARRLAYFIKEQGFCSSTASRPPAAVQPVRPA